METNTHTEDIAYFLSFCIEQYKHAKGIEGEQAERILNEAGALDFLAENYETLHTQGHRWLLAEIDEFIEAKEIAL